MPDTSDGPHSALRSLATRFGELRGLIEGEPDVEARLALVARQLLAAVPTAEQASVTRLETDGSFVSVGSTGPQAAGLDAIQHELGEGPCVEAAEAHTSFRVDDLATDGRWPEFAARAVEQFGISSVLSVRLFLDDRRTLAAVNLYASQRKAFDEDTEKAAGILATHAALALDDARVRDRNENLQRALETNRDIGVAMGILMQQAKLTREQAFDVLRMASQRFHRKLHDVAVDVIETGTLDL